MPFVCTPSVVRRWRTESEQTFQIPFLSYETLEKVNSQAVVYSIIKGLNVLCLNGVRDKDSYSVHRSILAVSPLTWCFICMNMCYVMLCLLSNGKNSFF